MKITIELENEDFWTLPTDLIEQISEAWHKVAYEKDIYGIQDICNEIGGSAPGMWLSEHFKHVDVGLSKAWTDCYKVNYYYKEDFLKAEERAWHFEDVFKRLYGKEAWERWINEPF